MSAGVACGATENTGTTPVPQSTSVVRVSIRRRMESPSHSSRSSAYTGNALKEWASASGGSQASASLAVCVTKCGHVISCADARFQIWSGHR